jgi:uncharacterized integral membrane protein
MNAKIIIIIVVLSLFLILTLQNTDVAFFKVFFWNIEMSRIVFMFISLLIGFIAGFIVAKVTGIEHKRSTQEKGRAES